MNFIKKHPIAFVCASYLVLFVLAFDFTLSMFNILLFVEPRKLLYHQMQEREKTYTVLLLGLANKLSKAEILTILRSDNRSQIKIDTQGNTVTIGTLVLGFDSADKLKSLKQDNGLPNPPDW